MTIRWSKAKSNTQYDYDAVGNLTLVNYPSSPDVTLAYDWLNRVTNMVDAMGTTKYAYAAGGQLWTEDGPWSSDTVTNVYFSRFRTNLSLAQPTGQWTNRFIYDAAKRLTNVTSPAGAFRYLFSGVTRHASRITLPNTSYITNSYDSVVRLRFTNLLTSSASLLDSAEYGYNAGNQRTTFTNAAGTYVQYTNDPIGQLRIANSSVNSEDRGYQYDAAWNLNYRTNNGTLGTFAVDGKNQLTSEPSGGTTAYDSNGNLTSYQNGYGTYTYDDENRLASAQFYTSWRTTFTYDGVGRLRLKNEYTWSGGAWNLSSQTSYLYDGWRVIQERVSGTPTVSYTRGTDLSGSLEGAGGIGGLLGRSHGYSSGNWSTHNFYHADGNGNITYLVNSSQGLAASYRFDPFGNTISSSGTLAAANVYRFSSKEFHANSGLYYYGYRWYAPNLQRWLNRDPLGESGFEVSRKGKAEVLGDGPNPYQFIGNNPIHRTDSLGLLGLFRLDICTCTVTILPSGGCDEICLCHVLFPPSIPPRPPYQRNSHISSLQCFLEWCIHGGRPYSRPNF